MEINADSRNYPATPAHGLSDSAIGFLDLPPELREEIYSYLVVKPQAIVTVLDNYECINSESSAGQPPLAKVNKQLRAEVLPLFYSSNVFLAEPTTDEDIEVAQRWVSAIGDVNVRYLRKLKLFGWVQPLTAGDVRRGWIRFVLDLQEGTCDVEGQQPSSDDIDSAANFTEVLTSARERKAMSGKILRALMEAFYTWCMAS